ncbi:hypothetical protein [Chamaesiphon minutus]|uniref:hypothetical protein n=1 Tax=Chamaesiphon minutus TaxID=1173032 RepID=UPI0002F03F5D|nr:hypothetical protein [Chamaesiphon minutus]
MLIITIERNYLERYRFGRLDYLARGYANDLCFRSIVFGFIRPPLGVRLRDRALEYRSLDRIRAC